MDYMSKTGLDAMSMMGWWAMDLIGLRVMGKGQLVAAGTVVTLGISLSLSESHVTPSSDYENMCTVQGVPKKCPIATFSLNLFQRSDCTFSHVFRNQNFEPVPSK